MKLAGVVGRLNKKLGRPVSITETAQELAWDNALAYKWAAVAIHDKLLAHQEGTNEKNQKFLIPVQGTTTQFLPNPASLLRANENLGDNLLYVDPLTGEERTLRRANSESGKPEVVKHRLARVSEVVESGGAGDVQKNA